MSTLTRPLPIKPGGHERPQLILNPGRGKGTSDGTWWPRTTNLQTELPALDVAVHQLTGSRIARIAYTHGQWQPAPRKQRTSLGMTKLGWFTHSTHPENIDLSLADYTHLVLTVIAPDPDPGLANTTLPDHGTPPTGLRALDTGHVDREKDEDRDQLGTRPPIATPIVAQGPVPPPWTTR